MIECERCHIFKDEAEFHGLPENSLCDECDALESGEES